MNILWHGWLQFPMSTTKSLKSQSCQYHTPPSLFGKQKIPSLSSSGLYGAHLPLFAKPLVHTTSVQYLWLTCNLSHQLTSKAGLITSPLRLFGPQGPGSGFSSVCAVSLSNLHDPLPLNEGEQGWEMRHFRAQGFIPTAQWITLQHTKGRCDSFFTKSYTLTVV